MLLQTIVNPLRPRIWGKLIFAVFSMMLLANAEHTSAIDFAADVQPILKAHCFKCHGENKQKGDLRLDTLSAHLARDRRAAERWHDVRDAINLGEMPPSEETQLTRKDRRILTSTKMAAE